MNKNIWIVFYFVALAGYIVGVQFQSRQKSVLYQGGRSYKIDFKKNVDRDKVLNDLTVAFEGQSPVIWERDNKTTFEIITAYMINQPDREIDSIVKEKLITGLKNYLPGGITHEQFDKVYTLSSYKVLPFLHDERPTWVKNMVDPFLQYGCKILLMPLLAIFFLVSLRNISANLKKWMLAALFFSWAGDVLLMFESSNANYFIFGLSAFLLAHIFYIVLFDQIRLREKLKQSLVPLLPIAFYYLALLGLLQPHLGNMGKPVVIYGLIISIMLSFAIDLWRMKDRLVSFYIILGALLFITSDSLLAINKFYKSFEYAGVAIMSTYGIAQLLITLGAERYISSTSKQ